MLWQAQSRRDVELLDKQDRIDQELEGFRKEIAGAPDSLGWEIREVLEHVHDNLFDPDLNVGAVRRECRLRNNNISSRFRCSVGIGPREYIEAARIEAACRLLRHRDLEIYLIAMAVGYGHQETFCRAFQRRKGCTPSEWRWLVPRATGPSRSKDAGPQRATGSSTSNRAPLSGRFAARISPP